MSQSLNHVMGALTAAGLGTVAIEMPSETRTAQQAADAAGCDLDQIAKSPNRSSSQVQTAESFISS